MNRILNLDYLRVLSAFAVMILHISAQNWYYVPTNSFSWQIFNLFDSSVRWAVPVFIMISGALFLNKKKTVKDIYSKYILRLMISFIFWGIIYGIIFNYGKQTILVGAYHMWFIPMIIGIYICLPILYKVVESKDIEQYFLILGFLFAILVPQTVNLLNDFSCDFLRKLSSIIQTNYSNLNLHLVLGYTFYFILGHYLMKVAVKKEFRVIIYILGIIGFIATFSFTSYLSIKNQSPIGTYYNNFSINVFFESIAIFIWFKYHSFKKEKYYPLIIKLSKYSFGAYLIHVLIIDRLNQIFGLNTLSFNPIISILFIGIIVFILSFLVSWICNSIPRINKYIV